MRPRATARQPNAAEIPDPNRADQGSLQISPSVQVRPLFSRLSHSIRGAK
jgi:hypothetical protein